MKIAPRLSLSFGAFSLILVGILGGITYWSSTAAIRRSVDVNNSSVLAQIEDAVSFQLEVLERLTDQVVLDPMVERLQDDSLTLETQVRLVKNGLLPALHRALLIPEQPVRLQLYLDNDRLPEIYYEDVDQQGTLTDPLSRGRLAEVLRYKRVRGEEWARFEMAPPFAGRYRFVETDTRFANISLLVPIVDRFLREQTGLLRVEVGLDDIFAAVDTAAIGQGARLLVHDSGTPIYQLPERVVPENGPGSEDGEENVIHFQREVEVTGWELLLSVPASIVRTSAASIATTTLAAALGTALLFVIVGVVLSRSVASRIEKIVVPIHAFRQGRLDARIRDRQTDELDEVVDAFNEMAEEIQDLIHRNERVLVEKQAAELGLLHARINPHFLFNVLSSMSKLVRLNRSKQAYDMILNLAQFYRRTLSDTAPVVPVATEIAQANSYIDLLTSMYGDDLTVETDLDDAIMGRTTLHFVLQPFVENAVQHAWKADTLRVTVVGRLEEDRLVFYISDNGVGIPEEQRACLLHDGEATGTERYGIRNVDQRIRIHHGDDYGVTIQSTVGVGTTITVTQPAITG